MCVRVCAAHASTNTPNPNKQTLYKQTKKTNAKNGNNVYIFILSIIKREKWIKKFIQKRVVKTYSRHRTNHQQKNTLKAKII